MKKDIHVTITDDNLEELKKISKITQYSSSKILNSIVSVGLKDIKKMNGDYSKFLAKYIINEDI